jgi:tetratricopeptide (TPR) repeat protein
LRSLTRAEASNLVQQAGGAVRDSVTGETSFLVVGDDVQDHPRGLLASRKLRTAERLNGEGGNIRILGEHEFLRLVGIEPSPQLAERWYTTADVRTLYSLDGTTLRQLERMRIIRPLLRNNNDRYYTFQDLLLFRRLREALDSGQSLGEIARRLRLERQGQMSLRLEESGPPRVIEFRRPEEEGWTAEDWYEVGCDCDEDPSDFAQAIRAYEHALELDPHHVGALINLGNVHYRLGQVDEARRLYELALALDPQNPKVHYNLGNVFDDLEDHRAAIQFFESAIRLRPESGDAHFNLGLVHDRLGDVEKVRQHMQAYLRLEPDGEMAEVAFEYLSLTSCEDGAPA